MINNRSYGAVWHLQASLNSHLTYYLLAQYKNIMVQYIPRALLKNVCLGLSAWRDFVECNISVNKYDLHDLCYRSYQYIKWVYICLCDDFNDVFSDVPRDKRGWSAMLAPRFLPHLLIRQHSPAVEHRRPQCQPQPQPHQQREWGKARVPLQPAAAAQCRAHLM